MGDEEGTLVVMVLLPPLSGVVVTCGDWGANGANGVLGAPIAEEGAGVGATVAGLVGSGRGTVVVDVDFEDCAIAGAAAMASSAPITDKVPRPR